MRVKTREPVSKLLGIWTFLLLLILKEAFSSAAYALVGVPYPSSLNTCAINPECVAVLGAELAPSVAAPTAAGSAATISVTTATGTSTTLEAASGVAVVAGDMRLSGVVAYHIWSQALNQQAQELARQKYCAANPNDAVCLPPFTGGQSPGVLYWAVSSWNCQMLQNSYGFQFEYCDDSSGYGSFYDLSHRVGAGITDLKGPVQFLGFKQALDQFNQGCWFMDVLTADGYRSERQVCNYGPQFPPPGKMQFAGMLRMDGQPDTGGAPPPLAWKDWSQEKRDAAVKLISPSDWQVYIPYLSQVGTLPPGDTINGPVFIPGQAIDDPNTSEDESLPRIAPGYTSPSPSPTPAPSPSPSPTPAPSPSPSPTPAPTPSPEPSPSPSPNPLPSPSPEPTPPPPPPLPEPEPETDGAGATSGGGYTNDRNSSLYSQLVNELRSRGEKFTEAKIVYIGRDQTGRVVWLETGNSKSGLKHIVKEHKIDFENVGILENQIPEVVIAAVTTGKIVGYQTPTRVIYEVTFNGKTQHIAVTVSVNGYIVGANPNPQ